MNDSASILQALRESNESLVRLFNESPAAIITLDPEGRVVMWNPSAQRIFGWTTEEVVGQINPIVPPERLKEFYDRHLTHSDGDQLYGLEVKRTRKDKSQVDVSISTAIIRDDNRKVERVLGVIVDITDRKRAEAEILELNATLEMRVEERTRELQEAIRDLESFSYSVSHDLRAPLRAIDGFSDILLEDYGDKLDDDGRRYLEVVRKNTQRMGQLIDDLLGFSRLGRAPMKSERVDVAALVKDIIEDLRSYNPDREIEFVVGELPPCPGDASMLRQVFVNLLSNAVKFTKKKQLARVEVQAEPDGEFTRYSVKDNGAGFDMAYANKLFGVFQRLHRADEFEGTGVGLAIVERIVTRHGGKIAAESVLGEGASFFLTLPVF